MAHLYNLRHQQRYRERRLHYTKTRPTAVSIGERRRPDPQGQPGYLRVDTVHQGDRPAAKGVYHINAVDEITQWEIVSATARISEAWLEPVLAAMLRQFPFPILGFHSDNGSEFINQTVARLLNKLLIEQTKSRPRHSNDNGLVETKNGAVIRKHMGYGYIHAAKLTHTLTGDIHCGHHPGTFASVCGRGAIARCCKHFRNRRSLFLETGTAFVTNGLMVLDPVTQLGIGLFQSLSLVVRQCRILQRGHNLVELSLKLL